MPRWTEESRLKQAEKIRNWSPWTKSTGPRTPEGRAKSRRNAFKGGVRADIATFAGVMREIESANREVISSFCRGAVFLRCRTPRLYRRGSVLGYGGKPKRSVGSQPKAARRASTARQTFSRATALVSLNGLAKKTAPCGALISASLANPAQSFGQSGVAAGSLPPALQDASRLIKRSAVQHGSHPSQPVGTTAHVGQSGAATGDLPTALPHAVRPAGGLRLATVAALRSQGASRQQRRFAERRRPIPVPKFVSPEAPAR